MKNTFFLLLILVSIFSKAQYTTLGTEFNFAFIQNRIDRNGAISNCNLVRYFNNYIYVSNNTADNTEIRIDFNGASVYYVIDGQDYLPVSGNETSFNLNGNSSVTIEIYPYDSLSYVDNCNTYINLYDSRIFQAMNNCQIETKTISIKSLYDIPITVFAENAQSNSRDVSMILPDDALGALYYAFSSAPSPMEYTVQHDGYNLGGPSEILLLAVENNTTINFKMPNNVSINEHLFCNFDAYGIDSIVGETYYSLTLNAGEIFQLQSDNFSLTGSFFSANNPFAVYSGNMANTLNCSGTCAKDHIYEQMLPLKNWGKKYIITPFNDGKIETIKIISMYGNNSININGTVNLLNQGEILNLTLNEGETMYIDAYYPICVAQYTSSSLYNGSHSANDPSMVMLTPLSQQIEGINLSIPITLPTSNPGACSGVAKTDYINIVTKTTNIDSIFINDFINPPSKVENYNGLSVNWTTISGNPDYSYCIVNVTNSSSINSKPIKLYSISSVKTGMNAIVSGFACAEAYTFNAGINVTKIVLETPNIDKNLLFDIVPNPAKSNINIKSIFNEKYNIEIFNYLGELVYKSVFTENKNINISEYASGVFFVKIYNNKTVYSKKFIKE